MTTPARSAKFSFLATGIALLIAIATGASWIGQPFRAVQLVLILGLGMTAGFSWAEATARYREK
jgi:hypothetical protein